MKNIFFIPIITCLLVVFYQKGLGQDITVFTNVHVIPMDIDTVLENHFVIVENDTIVTISAASTTPIPKDVTIIDGDGAYLSPGLMDMHTHLFNYDRNSQHLILYLAEGVTTVRAMSGAPEHLTWKKQVESGEIVAPTIYTSGRTLYGLYRDNSGLQGIVDLFYIVIFLLPLIIALLIYFPVRYFKRKENRGKITLKMAFSSVSALLFFGFILSWFKIISFMAISFFFDVPWVFMSETPSQAISEVRHQKEMGYDFIKLYDGLSEEEYLAAVKEAKKLGMYITGHAPNQIPLETLVTSGQAEFVHVDELLSYHWKGYNRGFNSDTSHGREYPIENETIPKTIQLLKENNISVVTTMVVDEIMYRLIENTPGVLSSPEYRVVRKSLLDGWKTNGRNVRAFKDQGAYRKDEAQPFLMQMTKALYDAGVKLTVGTDAEVEGMIPGYHLHRDLELLVESGLTPYAALQAGTKNAGDILENMGTGDKVGTIEIGHRADFILTKDNPLENISNTRNRIGVMARGKWFTQKELNKKLEQYVSMMNNPKEK
jgi:hypothetical protein